MKNNKLIGISGKMKSGKDTTAQVIQYLTTKASERWNIDEYLKKIYPNLDNYGEIYKSDWKIKKFADGLKDLVCLLTGCSKNDLESQEFKNRYLPEEWNCYFFDDYKETIKRYTYRDVLQYVGTDLLREQFHQNVWVNCLFSKYNDDSKWIISDVRFPNEVNRIKEKNGITINILRPQTDHLAGSHISETALDNYKDFDYVILNDGTYENLLNEVNFILNKENVI